MDYCPFKRTYLDSDCPLASVHIFMSFAECRKVTTGYQFETENAKGTFREGLARNLVVHRQQIYPKEAWNDFKAAVNAAAISASSLNPKVMKDQQISKTFSELVMPLKLIPTCSWIDNERQLKHRLTKGLHKDHGQRWRKAN